MSEPLKTVDMRTTTKPFSNSCVAPSSETSLSLLSKNDSGQTNRNEMHPFYYLHVKVVTFSRVSVNTNPLVTMILKPHNSCTQIVVHYSSMSCRAQQPSILHPEQWTELMWLMHGSDTLAFLEFEHLSLLQLSKCIRHRFWISLPANPVWHECFLADSLALSTAG